jgi:hypothetical protein
MTPFPTSNVTVNLQVKLTGQWANTIVVRYDDANNNFNVTCSTPAAPQTTDYSYSQNPNDTINFTVDSTSGLAIRDFPVTIRGLFVHASNQMDEFACFGINTDASYDIGTNDQNSIDIHLNGIGIQSFFDSRQIKIYPNPFTDQFVIENKSKTEISQISVTDMLGREITKLAPGNVDLIKVNTAEFAKGIYFIKVSNNTDSFTIKLIKE